MTHNSKRLNLELSEKAALRLRDLKSRTEAASDAEVIRNALRLYEAVVAEAEAGNAFLVRDKAGTLKEYVVF